MTSTPATNTAPSSRNRATSRIRPPSVRVSCCHPVSMTQPRSQSRAAAPSQVGRGCLRRAAQPRTLDGRHATARISLPGRPGPAPRNAAPRARAR
jgi:hypothetical protein